MLTSTNRRPAAAQRSAIETAEQIFSPRTRIARDHKQACPACGRRHPIAPVLSRHRPPASAEHDWRCSGCGHAWTTTTTMTPPVSAAGQGHRFPVGSQVRLIVKYGSRPAPSGPFTVIALRPSENGDIQYRIKSPSEGFERVVRDGELAAVKPDGDR
jgi:hypothetical protein